MSLENVNKSVCDSSGEQTSERLEYYTRQAASIPEWSPEADLLKEYENDPEERICIPIIDHWNPLLVLLAATALNNAQKNRGISNVFHDPRHLLEVALYRLSMNATRPQLIERWGSVDLALFEEGLLKHGKDFVVIKSKFLPHKTIKDLVEFYYTWEATKMASGEGEAGVRKFLPKRRSQYKSFVPNYERTMTRSQTRAKDQTDKSSKNAQIKRVVSTKRKRRARKN